VQVHNSMINSVSITETVTTPLVLICFLVRFEKEHFVHPEDSLE